MEHVFNFAELLATLLALGLTAAFGAWAGIVKRAADRMEIKFDQAVTELGLLRQEIHKDRVHNEKRFVRLEVKAGLSSEE